MRRRIAVLLAMAVILAVALFLRTLACAESDDGREIIVRATESPASVPTVRRSEAVRSATPMREATKSRAAPIRIRVVDDTDRPIAGARVFTATKAMRRATSEMLVTIGTTNADGVVVVDAHAETWSAAGVVGAECPGRVTTTRRIVVGESSIVLQLAESAIFEATCRDDANRPVVGARVVLRTAATLPGFSGIELAAAPTSMSVGTRLRTAVGISDEFGKVRIDGLPKGTYYSTVFHATRLRVAPSSDSVELPSSDLRFEFVTPYVGILVPEADDHFLCTRYSTTMPGTPGHFIMFEHSFQSRFGNDPARRLVVMFVPRKSREEETVEITVDTTKYRSRKIALRCRPVDEEIVPQVITPEAADVPDLTRVTIDLVLPSGEKVAVRDFWLTSRDLSAMNSGAYGTPEPDGSVLVPYGTYRIDVRVGAIREAARDVEVVCDGPTCNVTLIADRPITRHVFTIEDEVGESIGSLLEWRNAAGECHQENGTSPISVYLVDDEPIEMTFRAIGYESKTISLTPKRSGPLEHRVVLDSPSAK